mmetsp:Transcript_103521/g.292228  ORF Transcript_103521/g.292228 Transcript_103521/m.292228 type:complete len:84 (-) Transcript_103521:421-672(-)
MKNSCALLRPIFHEAEGALIHAHLDIERNVISATILNVEDDAQRARRNWQAGVKTQCISTSTFEENLIANVNTSRSVRMSLAN